MATQFSELTGVQEGIDVQCFKEVSVPQYSEFKQPIVSFGKQGSAPGKLNRPLGVSINPTTNHIYVSEWGSSRIQIFSQTGDYLYHFGNTHLIRPWGILIHQDNMYVTDVWYHAVFLFRLLDLTMMKRVGKEGSGREEFNIPRQLAISPNQHLYVTDQNNNRLQILTTNLKFEIPLKHQTITSPIDVKFSINELFVLSIRDNPRILVFTRSGDKSRKLVTTGIRMNLHIFHSITPSSFFCLDTHDNILISSYFDHNIKVFSPEGDLLHTIGKGGEEAGEFHYPTGIAILDYDKLICLSMRSNFAIHIFYAFKNNFKS